MQIIDEYSVLCFNVKASYHICLRYYTKRFKSYCLISSYSSVLSGIKDLHAVFVSSIANTSCSLLLGNPKFRRPISRSVGGRGDHEVARVGRPATDYEIVVSPWESSIRPCISCCFPKV